MSKLFETVRRDARETSRDWVLTIVLSPCAELERKSYTLDGPLVRLNRDEGDPDGIALNDPAVSQGKVELVRTTDDTYDIIDKGARNPARVNGIRVEERTPLASNSVIRVGDTLIVLERSEIARGKNAKENTAGDQLLRALCLFDSTAASVLQLESHFLDPAARGVAIEAEGFTETRIVADWLSEHWEVDLERVDAADDNAFELLSNQATDIVVLVERLDAIEDEGRAAKLADAIEYRARGPQPRRVAFSYGHAEPRSQVMKLLETAIDSKLGVPPLTDRRADILVGIRHMMREHGAPDRFVIPPICAEKLLCYAWPTGLGELNRVARRLARQLADEGSISRLGLTAEIRAVDLSPDQSSARTLDAATFEQALLENEGNMTDVANHFGFARGYFYRLLRQKGIDVQEARRRLDEQ